MAGQDNGNWDPTTNSVAGSDPESIIGLERYERWLDMYRVAQAYDEHHDEYPTAIARKFDMQREIPEEQVERLLLDLLESPTRKKLAAMVEQHVGRPLGRGPLPSHSPSSPSSSGGRRRPTSLGRLRQRVEGRH